MTSQGIYYLIRALVALVAMQCFEPSSRQYRRAISMVGVSGCSYHV